MRSPAPGDPAPDFTLSTPIGKEVSLVAALAESAVLVEFLRGLWDPAARERIEALRAHQDEIRCRDLSCLLVSCERTDDARVRAETANLPFSLLIDSSRSVCRRYGVLRRFSFGAINVARPASFLVDRCGFVRYAYVGRSPIDAAPLETLLHHAAELAAERREPQGAVQRRSSRIPRSLS